jgi:hypothetical protein
MTVFFSFGNNQKLTLLLKILINKFGNFDWNSGFVWCIHQRQAYWMKPDNEIPNYSTFIVPLGQSRTNGNKLGILKRRIVISTIAV